MNFANSVPVESPDLVSFSDPPVKKQNITDGGTGSVATSIADKDGIFIDLRLTIIDLRLDRKSVVSR